MIYLVGLEKPTDRDCHYSQVAKVVFGPNPAPTDIVFLSSITNIKRISMDIFEKFHISKMSAGVNRKITFE